MPASQAAASQVFRASILIYAIVRAQMGSILRPFIGAPNAPFQWFRARLQLLRGRVGVAAAPLLRPCGAITTCCARGTLRPRRLGAAHASTQA